MSRITTPLVNDETYHVFNRGAAKCTVFKDKKDYARFYDSLSLFNSQEPIVNYHFARATRAKHRNRLVEIQAYSLLPNHFHILLTQIANNGISEFLRRLTGGYTSYFNEKYERSGVLFQGRFKRVHVDSQEYFQYLFAYVNENHHVHRIKRPDEIMYSSSLHYQGKVMSKALNPREQNKGHYLLQENVSLARDIYKRRRQQRHLLLEA